MQARWTVLLTVPGALAACAYSSGIIPVGPGIYSVSEMRAPARGGELEAQRAVFAKIATFCGQQNRVVLPLATQPDGDPFTPYGPTAFDATFRCVPPGDPALADTPAPPLVR